MKNFNFKRGNSAGLKFDEKISQLGTFGSLYKNYCFYGSKKQWGNQNITTLPKKGSPLVNGFVEWGTSGGSE